MHRVGLVEENKKKKNFNIEYRKVKRACSIEKIENHKVFSINWSNVDTNVYTTLFSMFNAFNSFTVSYDYLAGECNLHRTTIIKSVLKMKDFGIIQVIQSGKKINGCFSPNKFNYVVDLEESKKFKCITNKYKKAYDKKKKDRDKRLLYLQGVVTGNNWIEAQFRNYWRNINYELITGEYLTGDKTEKLLYKHSQLFTPNDDLKQYEINIMLERKE